MSENTTGKQVSLQVFGLLIYIPGVMAIASLPVGWFFNEFYATVPLLVTALVSLGTGFGLYRWLKPYRLRRMRGAVAIVAAAWLIISIIGAIPYLLVASHIDGLSGVPLQGGEFSDPWNALFESMAGFTSSGLSVANDSSLLPHWIQWWRSFTQWVGGVGLVVLVLSVLDPQVNSHRLYRAEARDSQFASTLKRTTQKIWGIYLVLTLISIGLFLATGMSPWAAINHGMTGIATGGFTITTRSFQDYSPAIKLAAVPVMVMGAISFSMYASVLNGQISRLWRDSRYRALWGLLVAGTVLLLLENYWDFAAWRGIDSLFQWTSALTTCGFAVVDETQWSISARLLMVIGMVFGSISGSTVGGLKLDRIVILWKATVRYLRMVYMPTLNTFKFPAEGGVLSEKEALQQLKWAVIPTLLWIGAIGLGSIVLLHVLVDASFTNIVFEVASALGTTGLSTGIVDANSSWISKLMLILLMWAGRLEIIPVIILVSWLPRLLQRGGNQSQRKIKPPS